MASATKYTNIYASYGAYYGLYVEFVENSTSVANNTSSITLSASLSSQNRSGWSAGSNSTLTLYWHDNRENYDRWVSSISFSGVGVGETKTTSGTIDVTHNDDGSLSGYAYVYFAKGGSSAYAPASSGLQTDWTALTTIARYPTLTNGSNFTDIQNPVYNISNPASLYNIRVKIEAGGNTQLIIRDIASNYRGNYTLELTESERNTLRALTPNSKTLAVRETICAMSGNTELNASYKDYTMTIVNASPTFDSSYLDSNSTTTAITGDNQQIIRNQSTLEIDVSNATAYKYATLSSIKATINGTNYTATLSGGNATFNIGTLNVSTNTNAVITLTDSRGFTATQTLALEVLNWELPTAIIDLQRENNYYSNTNINVDANYSSLDSHNTITLKTRYKKVTDSSYGSYVTLQDNVTSTLNLDNNYQWDVQVLVQDLLGQTTYNLTLDRGIPIVYFDRLRRSVGVNCFPQLDTSIELNGLPIGSGGSLPIGSIIEYPTSDPTKIPSGYLLCDGSEISRTEYPDLFDLIGTSFGAGNGTSTFNLPNYKGRVSVGYDSNDTDFNSVGKTGGSKELQKHTHTYVIPGNVNPTSHSYSSDFFTYAGWGSSFHDSIMDSQSAGTGNSGNLQPYLVVVYIIKATTESTPAPQSSEIVNSYTESESDAYSCDYINNNYRPTILYDNPSGSNGAITLSDSSSNYSYLEVYFFTNDGLQYEGYQKCMMAGNNNTNHSLMATWTNTNGSCYFKVKNISISGNTISNTGYAEVNLSGGAPTTTASNNIYIRRVIGYK